MTFVIAIPSYDREDTIQTKTLNLLKDVNPSIIHIFVADDAQAEKYKCKLGTKYKIIVGRKGITQQRNFIMDYFPVGAHIVSMDDDIERVVTLSNNGKMVTLDNIYEFIHQAFKDLEDRQLSLFGVYPTPNAFYLKNHDPITTNLKFIIGGFHGFINRRLYLEPKEKEDVHFTILNFMKDKGVIRYNHVSYKTKFHAKGGLGLITERFEANQEAAEFLSTEYPQYARIKVRKSGMWEIMLREFKTCSSKQKTLR